MEKKKNKVLVILVIVVAIVIGVVAFIGIMQLSKSIVNNIVVKAEEESKKPRGKRYYTSYLEEKYGKDKDFECIDIEGGDFFVRTDNIATIKSNDLDETFKVISRNSKVIGDTYIGTKYKKEMNNTIKEIANNIFEESVVLHSPSAILSETLSTNSSFEEYLNEAEISATIAVPKDSYEETKILTLAKKVQELGIEGIIRFVAISKQKYDNLLDEIQIDKMIGTEDCKHFVMIDIYPDDISIDIDYTGAKHYQNVN